MTLALHTAEPHPPNILSFITGVSNRPITYSVSISMFSEAQWFKLWCRLYAPFIGSGIRVIKVATDFRHVEVKMKLRWFNKNYVGTHYGGSMYSMTDPFYMAMLIKILGKDYVVWDKSARIEFLKPGKTELCAEFHISDKVLEEILAKTRDGSPHFAEFHVNVTDAPGDVVAKVDKTVYIRKKKQTAVPSKL